MSCRIVVVGTGYVGLVSGACLADIGHEVVCIDSDVNKVELLKEGEIPFYEPGLSELVGSNVENDRLRFETSVEGVVPDADAVFIAVGTPSASDGRADLSQVYNVVRQLAPCLAGETVVINKSTVPVGTGAVAAKMFAELVPEKTVEVVSNPEFLREGSAIGDFRNPDRVVIGSDGDLGRRVLDAIYQPLAEQGVEVLHVSRPTAELIKYASNAFLATKVAFINEMAELCEASGADVLDVAHGMGTDTRIGSKFLQAGPGYGGSCFPKDTRALVSIAEDFGVKSRVVESTIESNEARKASMVGKIVAAVGGDVKGKTIGILGFTFKSNTDDMREAPSLVIVPALIDLGAKVQGFDPQGMEQAKKFISGVDWKSSCDQVAAGADALVILTEWGEFANMDLPYISSLMNEAVMVDLRNLYSSTSMGECGFKYYPLGRPTQ